MSPSPSVILSDAQIVLSGQWEPPEVDSGIIHTVLEVSLLPGMKFYSSSELQSVISPKS